MQQRTRVFSAVTARDGADLPENGQPKALLCWRIGPRGQLQRAGTPAASRGGLLGLVGLEGLGCADLPRLAEDVRRECAAFGLGGVVLDAALPPQLQRTVRLCRALRSAGLPVYAPEALAAEADFAVLSAAVSGGDFSGLLDALCRRFGAERLCIDLLRVCNLFDMPSDTADGVPVPIQTPEALRRKYGGAAFFSPALCTNCFTFAEGERVRFLLFDDKRSREKKLQCIREKNIAAAVLLRREWEMGSEPEKTPEKSR